jgi:myosin regulatory light chain 12
MNTATDIFEEAPTLLRRLRLTMSRYPDYLSANTTPTKGGRGPKSRARREPSGVFSMFQAPQVQQFKEAFQLIDHDKDGWVSESDLKEFFSSLGTICGTTAYLPLTIAGISPSRQMLDELLNARPGTHSRSDDSGRGVNFTMFLTMMGERLFEFDTEAELLEAFESFDENDTGYVKVEEMRKWLSEVGERMDQGEVGVCARHGHS